MHAAGDLCLQPVWCLLKAACLLSEGRDSGRREGWCEVRIVTRLGRRILRPLLRTELGEVSNRRAWAQPDRLTPDIVALYSAPLRVQGWDAALLEARPFFSWYAGLQCRAARGESCFSSGLLQSCACRVPAWAWVAAHLCLRGSGMGPVVSFSQQSSPSA